MNNIKITIGAFLLLYLSSCYTTLSTHEQVMNGFRTKRDVIDKFGLPTEKRSEGDIEQWYYDFGNVTKKYSDGSAMTNVSLTNNGATAYTNSGTTTTYRSYDRYVKFIINKDGQIDSWNSVGVNYGQKVNNKGKTALAVGIIGALGLILVVLAASGSGGGY